MKHAWRELNAQRAAEGRSTIESGIALNTGEVTAGSLGASGGDLPRIEYAVVGDPVNLAQRIESHASNIGILIGEATLAEVAEHVVVHALPALTLQGKTEQVPVYLVLGLRGGELVYTADELARLGFAPDEIEALVSRRTLPEEGE
jgi:class 3 adenylate cyclase